MTLLVDRDISALAENDIFMPFCGEKMRRLDNGLAAISFGLSHAGYDIRLSGEDFLIVAAGQKHKADLDPKAFDTTLAYQGCQVHGPSGSYFRLPPHSYGLGVSTELINMPSNVIGFCFGKSTYARCGIIVNVTPIEPGWSGHLTINIINPNPFPARIYINEGIVQVVMFSAPANVDQDYGDGKYQNAEAKVQFAAV